MELQVKNWQKNQKELSTILTDMMPKMTASYDRAGRSSHSGGENRPTEDAAIRLASSQYILQLQLSIDAVQSVYDRLSDEDRELVRLRYWDNSLTPDGIALKMNLSKSTVYSRLALILTEIGRRMGVINIM